MKNKAEILSNASALTIINDGQVRYPVETVAMTAWIATNGEITAANYEQFCDDVPCVGEREIGTPGNAAMVDLCEELVAAGADVSAL